MYRLQLKVNELETNLMYNDYAMALVDFKQCVCDVFEKTDERDEYMMRITKDYAIFVVECKEASFKVELTKEVK